MDLDVNLGKLGIGGNSHYFREVSNPKLEEIKKLLDGKNDKEKLEGMKRLIASISKGRDVSSLFPDVVKLVVCQNIELKKLVYIYLVHYAESQSETALLAINTFQKGLENKNQLIRSMALRVMSSIRVRLISNLVVMAIKSAARDGSPYVRKTAAHAIPKVYSQDQDQKEVLTEIIQDLLGDKQTIVLGSAIAAFNEVCPERLDLIHPHYRKLCNLLADIDEWGQIAILTLLTRYGRSQFVNPDPDKDKEKKPKKPKKPKKSGQFYSDSDSDSGSSSSESDDDLFPDFELDPDHRLLLRCAQPLLQSRNNGVVMAVASLYYYLAPVMEAQKVGKSLVRIVRSQREVAYVVLANIASMAAKRPSMFSPYIPEFFVNATDPSFCRELKLEILTYLASESSIHKILRELHNYVHRDDKQFVTATVQAIARCALQIPEVMDTCMHGLISLMRGKNDAVVAESVIAIKKLLQTGTKEHDSVISYFAKNIDNIKVPEARASMIWVIGEYCDKIPKLAPDVLRKLAKSFTDEESVVKIQVLNLGAKLHLTNPDQTTQLFQYILTMAKYDVNYDIRDKARVMKQIMLSDTTPRLFEHTKELFFSEKPVPQNRSPSEERSRWALGSLSHLVKHTAYGYQAIPDFPEVAPDPSVRNIIVIAGKPTDAKNFYESDEERSYSSDSGSYSDEDSRSYSSEESRSDSEDSRSDRSYDSDDSYSRSGSSDESDESSSSDDDRRKKKKKNDTKKKGKKEPPKKQTKPVAPVKSTKPAANTSRSAFDDFLDFGTPAPTTPSAPSTPSNGLDLGDAFGGLSLNTTSISPTTVPLPRYVLLNPVSAGGLGIEYNFLRRPSMYGEKYCTAQLLIRNATAGTLSNIKIGKMMLEPGTEIVAFPEISFLSPGASLETLLHISFGSLNQPARFEVWHNGGHFTAQLAPVVGELVRAVSVSPQDFAVSQKKLSGLNEAEASFALKDVSNQLQRVPSVVLENAFVNPVTLDTDGGKFQFAGRTVIDNKLLLISLAIDTSSGKGRCKVNCENAIMGSMLANTLKGCLQKL